MRAATSPWLLLFACERCLPPDEEPVVRAAAEAGFGLRVVRLPCSSAVEVFKLLRGLELGADAVGVVGCPPEECRLADGSRRAERRMKRAQVILEETGLGGGRLLFRHRGSAEDPLETLAALVEAARAAGASPFSEVRAEVTAK